MTLIELVVSIALLAGIILAGTAFYFYGTSTFRVSENKAQIQRNARLAADYMVDQLRNSGNLIMLPAASPFPAGYTKGILLNDGTFKGITPANLTGAPSVDHIQNITVSFRNEAGKVLLHYSIYGSYLNESYNLAEDIILNNIIASELQLKIDFIISYSLVDYILFISGDI